MTNLDDIFQEKLPYDPYRYHPPTGWAHHHLKVMQMRFTMLGGRNPHGEPRLRMMWGPDITKFWDGRWIPKYVVAKAQIERRTPEGVIYHEPVLYGYPNYFVEKWRVPEQFAQPGTDPQKDWSTPIINRDPMGNVLEVNLPDHLDTTRQVEDMIGEFPGRGRYDYFYRVNPPFRDPTDLDFQIVQKRWKESIDMMYRDPKAIEAEEESRRASERAARREKYADAYGKDLLKNWEVISRGAAGRKASAIMPHEGMPDRKESK